MQYNTRKVRFPLYFILACGAFPLLYIVFSTDGDMWVDRSLIVGKRASLTLCATVFALAFIERSKRLFICACILLVFWIVGPIPGYISCAFDGFTGGDDRTTNCGLEAKAFTGFLAFALVVALQIKDVVPIMLLAFLIVPVGFVGTNYYLSNALSQEIVSTDLEKECFVSQPNYYASPFDKSSATRIWEVEDLQLGWVIGEHSPRIFRIAKGEAEVWKFSQRAFARGGTYSILAEFCEGEELS